MDWCGPSLFPVVGGVAVNWLLEELAAGEVNCGLSMLLMGVSMRGWRDWPASSAVPAAVSADDMAWAWD